MPPHHVQHTLAIIAAAALATLAACAPTRHGLYANDAQAFSDDRAIRLDAPAAAAPLTLDIDLPVATVTIERRPGVAEIAIDYQAHAATRELLKSVTLDATNTNGTLVLRATGPDRTGPKQWYISRLEIAVPSAERVVVRTDSGRILVSGLGPNDAETFLDAQPHRLISASGDITALDLAGPLTINTTSGNTTVTRGIGDLIVDAASGNIVVTDREGSVNIVSASGTVDLRRARKPFTINTVSGTVGVSLGAPFNGLVRTNTHTGEIDAVRTTDNPNAASSSVTTTTGSITITD